MGRHRKPTRREANPQRGRDYTDVVIEFMDSWGYICQNRAEHSGSRDDLEFIPKVNGRPIIAEAKNVRLDQDGLSPNNYKEGFAEYFLKWAQDSELEFHFFVTNESNPRYWDQLFDENPDIEEVENFFDKILDAVDGDLKEQLSRYDAETFVEFARDTTVWNYTISELELQTKRAEETGHYDYEPYHTSYPPIQDGQGRLSTNLFEITQLPSTIYEMSLKGSVSADTVYNDPELTWVPIEMHDGRMHSLLPPDELSERVGDIVGDDKTSIPVSDFLDSPNDDQVDLMKALLKRLLAFIAEETDVMVGERQDGAVTVAYFPHSEPDRRSEKNVNGRWVAKQAESHPVVRHRAVEINVKQFAGDFYYAFSPKQEFTTDGETLVSSDRKNDLTSDFSKSSYPQNHRTRKNLELWADVLNPSNSFLRFGQPTAVRELTFEHVGDISVECRSPEDSDELNEHIKSL